MRFNSLNKDLVVGVQPLDYVNLLASWVVASLLIKPVPSKLITFEIKPILVAISFVPKVCDQNLHTTHLHRCLPKCNLCHCLRAAHRCPRIKIESAPRYAIITSWPSSPANLHYRCLINDHLILFRCAHFVVIFHAPNLNKSSYI